MNDERVYAEDKKTPAWASFVEAMRGRQYGPSETLDAWLWFKDGWMQKEALAVKEAALRTGLDEKWAATLGWLNERLRNTRRSILQRARRL